ncbi:MAG TPA: hypothetical protein GX717_05120 [Clostridiaceae bacterium]|nr:hypothetical protein [Clostridiaceae bacterium]
MNQIINGVSYDTTTATLIGEYDNGYPIDDIRWCITQIFKLKGNKYFLYGQGGPGSTYARIDDCCTYEDGEKIIPVSLCDIIVWGEDHLPDNELASIIREHMHEATLLGLEVPAYLQAVLRRLSGR